MAYKQGQTLYFKSKKAAANALKKVRLAGFGHSVVSREPDGVYAVHLIGSRANPSVRTAPKSAIPAKFTTAKVRRVGNKVQILLNK